jgi:hypothetical protein
MEMRYVDVTAAFTVIASVLLGCGNGTIEPPPPPHLDPAAIIESIEVFFGTRDIDDLEECFADDFTFYFDQDDIGNQVGDYTIPESWTPDDFLNAVNNIFSNGYSIDMSIASANVGEPDADDAYYTADNVQMRFLVMVDPENGYLAQGFATFEFRKEVNEKNEQEWLVTAWRDFTAPDSTGDKSIVPASFGEILVRYHKP